jgi:hypothetical protein
MIREKKYIITFFSKKLNSENENVKQLGNCLVMKKILTYYLLIRPNLIAKLKILTRQNISIF